MNVIDPSTLNIVFGLPPIASKGDKVAYDSEFFNQTKSKLHIPHGVFAYLGCTFDGQTVYCITDSKDIPEFFDRIKDAVWIGHNLKYDIRQLRRFAHIPQRTKLWDSLLIEQIMYSGYYKDFSLKDLARRYLNIYMSKEVRETFGESESLEMTKDQINYSCVDVVVSWKVYKAQRAIISESDLDIWKDIELPFLWTILGMSGIRLDVDKWLALAEYNKRIAEETQAKYGNFLVDTTEWDTSENIGWDGGDGEAKKVSKHKKTKTELVGINLASPLQVKRHLKSLGYNLAGTGAEYLEKIQDECEFAKDLLLFRNTSKRSSTYGAKFVEDNVENGVIYSDIYQIGAETGRTSSRNPNLQNQPHEDKYRDCFIADENECLIIADWSSQEPRIAAYFSQDENLIAALNSDEKLYVRIARDALGISITKESPEYKAMKSTILGIFYGMRAKALGERIGQSEENAQKMINLILKTYPGIADYISRQKQAKDFVTSIYGRKVWLNKYDYQWENNALNAPIQSSAAEAMKIAAYRVSCELAGDNFYQNTPLKLLVHDEIGIGSKVGECEKNTDILKNTMIEVAEAMHDGITANADVFSGNSWSCKH